MNYFRFYFFWLSGTKTIRKNGQAPQNSSPFIFFSIVGIGRYERQTQVTEQVGKAAAWIDSRKKILPRSFRPSGGWR